jgi:hypothetical protein
MSRSLPLTSTARPASRHCLALALQCLPLLAAAACVIRGVAGEAAQTRWFTGRFDSQPAGS